MNFFVVGGAVRDVLLGREVKDVDFVVVSSTPEEMLAAGFQQVGADFPVFLDDQGQEFALARTERKTGSGYHGFETDFNPNVTLEEDLIRRDLTINAMAVPLLYWEEFQKTRNYDLVIDPFNGIRDLEMGVLRHVSEAFAEDPVRVLRVARFSARYEFIVDSETLELMEKLVLDGELNELTPERVFAELEKAMMEDFPINFFRVLNVVQADKVLFNELNPIERQPLMIIPSLDRAVMLKMDFLSRMVILTAGSNPENIMELLARLKAPNELSTLLKMSTTFVKRLMDYHNDFDNVDAFADVIDEIHAWRLPEIFLKVMQTLAIFDNDFIHTSVFKFLRLHREGSKARFNMLSDEQKATLKGKEISNAIADLRRELMRGP
jgi:tRNA nucleotidyltransferase (CCA-adding enzyme)